MNKYTSLTIVLLIPSLLGIALITLLNAPDTVAVTQNVIVVDTLIDENDGSCADGDCSLRDAIATASSGDTVNFNVNGTIDISPLGHLSINNIVTIDGGEAITITGNNSTRLFRLSSGQLALNGLTLLDGEPNTFDCGAGSQTCGGAIYASTNTVLTVTNSLITNNHASFGGAIYSVFGSTTIIDSTVSNNSSVSHGGAVYTILSGQFTAVNSTFAGNATSSAFGGALYLEVSSGTIENSTFTNNSANHAGAIYAITGAISVQNSTFNNNTASSMGGAIEIANGTHSIHNSTISGNSATNEGGGIFNRGHLTLVNSTVTNNRAGTNGAGILSSFVSNNSTTVTNTIVVDNIINIGGFADDVALHQGPVDTFISGGNNLIGAVGANINAFSPMSDILGITEPQLDSLQDNGGSTLTHAPLDNSFAINAANAAACPAIDQRGIGRPQGAGCDIGAFELDQFSLNVAVAGSGAGIVTSSPSGIDCGNDCLEIYAADSMVTLTPMAGSNTSFTGWSGACMGTAVCTVTLDTRKSVTATFTLDEQEIYLPLIIKP